MHIASLEIPGRAHAAGHPIRIASIDGLRAIAILLVIVDHYTPWLIVGKGPVAASVNEVSGWAGSGVDLFFVLSGFLITGILVDSKHSSNYFSRFYWRRSLRIFPAFYTFLIPVWFMPRFFTGIGRAWFAFYLRNWRGADPASDGTLGHLWSLAVEEQFYIVWSIVVFLVAARWLPFVTVALIGIAPMVRFAMGHLGYAGYLIFRITPARMDSLLFGALVALALRSAWRAKLSVAALLGVGVSVAGLAIARIAGGRLDADNRVLQVAFLSFVPLLYASVLALCLRLRPGSVWNSMLTNRFFRAVAKYSYAIYLIHLASGNVLFLLLQAIDALFPGLHSILAILFIPTGFAFAFGLAALSWRYIEAPALALKDRFFVARSQTSPEVLA